MLRTALILYVVLTLITGVLFPLVITGAGQVLFPSQANGSVIQRDGVAIGSKLIGQEFADPGQLWSRPSATGPVPYTSFNGSTLSGSSGSNWGPTATVLLDSVKARIAALNAADASVGLVRAEGSRVPVDLVTASASGLDPSISVAAAEYQIPRIAMATGLPEETLRTIVEQHTTPRLFGLLGESTVHVLEVNLAIIDEAKKRTAH